MFNYNWPVFFCLMMLLAHQKYFLHVSIRRLFFPLDVNSFYYHLLFLKTAPALRVHLMQIYSHNFRLGGTQELDYLLKGKTNKQKKRSSLSVLSI